MPYRKPYRRPRRPFRKRRFVRKRNLVRKRNTGTIGRNPVVSNFSREIWKDLDLAGADVESIGFPDYWLVASVDGGTRLNFQPRINLAEIINYTEFQSLFDQYKINALSVTFYPTYTTSNDVASPLYAPPSLLCFAKQNFTGVDELTLTQDNWAEIIRKRTSIFCAGRKPHPVYSKTKVLVPTLHTDGSISNTSTMVRPMRWQSTQDIQAQNTCLTMSLATMDNTPLNQWTERLLFKMRVKVYFQCRFVK